MMMVKTVPIALAAWEASGSNPVQIRRAIERHSIRSNDDKTAERTAPQNDHPKRA